MDELKEKIKTLEEENKNLKETIEKGQYGKLKPITTSIDTYKGYPVLRFEGPFRPFSFGYRKASAIVEHFDAVKDFVENHKPEDRDKDKESTEEET